MFGGMIAMVLIVTAIAVTAHPTPPIITNHTYTGPLESVTYKQSGGWANEVLSSTLIFTNGLTFEVDGYKDYGAGFTYTINWTTTDYLDFNITYIVINSISLEEP